MSISRDEVIEGYKAILGRYPENETVISWHAQHSETIWQFICSLLASKEFWARADVQESYNYRGFTDDDIELIKKYQVQSTGKQGFVTSFLGCRTNVNFFKHLDGLSGMVEGLPIPGNFHASTVEWVGALKAVNQASDSFSVAELGAGWGPWLVNTALAAKARGIGNLYLLGIEADPGHFQYLQEHLAENGFELQDCHLVNGVAAQYDGIASFPIIDSQVDWGGAAIFDHAANVAPEVSDPKGSTEYRTLKAYSLETLLADHANFDLCHFDVQGAEFAIISTSRDLLCSKVRILVIGTHSRKIEGDLVDMLSGDGWILENERPGVFFPEPNSQRITTRNIKFDGTQVWRNPRL